MLVRSPNVTWTSWRLFSLTRWRPLAERVHNERPDYPCTFKHYADKHLNLVCPGQESEIAECLRSSNQAKTVVLYGCAIL